jgi:hypothetical protein
LKFLRFPEKEAKSVVPLRGRFGHLNLGEADPGGLGASPQKRVDKLVSDRWFDITQNYMAF